MGRDRYRCNGGFVKRLNAEPAYIFARGVIVCKVLTVTDILMRSMIT